MKPRIARFWDALEALTYAETIEVAGDFRDAWDVVGPIELGSSNDWASLLNTAQEIASSSADEQEAA